MAIYQTQAQNACFGSYLFNAETSFAPDVRFTPYFQLNPGWAIQSRTWVFGDGTTSDTTSTYFFHSYPGDTAVDVCLIVNAVNINDTTQHCSDTLCKRVHICPQDLYGNIASTHNAGAFVFTIYPVSYSFSYPANYWMDFGDGTSSATTTATSSSTFNITKTYANTGTYVATLHRQSSLGCESDTSIFVTVDTAANCNAHAAFTYTSLGGNAIQFTNTSTASNSFNSYWSFYNASGVISSSFAASPSFTFTGSAPYKAKLTITETSTGCKDSIGPLTISITTPTTYCVTLQPGSAGIDAVLSEYQPTANYGNHPEFYSSQWTYSSNPRESRSLLKFDLSTIPVGATINSATLSLYACPNNSNSYAGQPTYGTNNASYLKQVTSGWSEGTVTWNTQPTTTTTNQVLLAQSTNTSQSYTNLNVANFVQQWVSTPSQNYGMMLDMIGTAYYNAMVFCSSDHDSVALRPKLTICYTLNCSTHAAFTYTDQTNNNATFTNTSTSYTVAEWTFSNASGPIGTSLNYNPSFMYSGLPPYSATLIVKDSTGCTDTLTQVVNLTPPTVLHNCITIQPDSAAGVDAVIFQNAPTTNYGSHEDYLASQWTYNGTPGESRSLLKFDLSAIPAGAVITSAKISLYANTASSNGYAGTPTYGNNNACYLKRVLSSWNENTVTWNNQPLTVVTSQATLAQSTSTSQDYLNIDVTPMAQYWVNNPGNNYGVLLDMIGTAYYNSLIFYSSDHPNQAKHPKIEICYTTCNATHASFTYEVLPGNTAAFTNTSTPVNGSNSWEFRNGSGSLSTSSSANPQFTFTGSGPYTAQLIVRDTTSFCADTVTHTIYFADNCAVLQPGPHDGIDAAISNYDLNQVNNGYDINFTALNWTHNGVPFSGKGIMKFDLGTIPVGATITSAQLMLYADTASQNGYYGQPTYGTNNASRLYKVTQAWDENTVNWNNQPTYSTTNSVLLPQATSTSQNYTLDVKNFVQDWVNTPTQNYGMLLQMIGTNYYNLLTFGSSDYAVPAKRPKLSICFQIGTACAHAEFTDTIVNDSAYLTNTSTPLGAIASYEVVVTQVSSGVVTYHATSTGTNFADVNSVPLVHDSLMRVCLITHDTSGTCTDTFCTNVFSGVCSLAADFNYTATGSTVLFYDNSLANPTTGLTYYWTFSGGIPATSTVQNPSAMFPNYGNHTVCLVVTSAQGCSDTTCSVIVTSPPALTDTLCGMVFNDANNNGIFDFGEHARPNSIVSIDNVSYITDSLGFYHIPVYTGNHSIVLLAPSGWVQTYPLTPLTYSVTTTVGDYICGLDFGMRDDTLVLSGIAYVDNNGNGLYDSGDLLRANVPVYITGINGNYTVLTNAQGFYSQVVYSGTYSISSTAPSGYVFTQPLLPNTYTVTAVTTSISGLNFGVRNNNATISGLVYIDANNNGVYNSGEPLVANQPVHIGATTVYTNSVGAWSIVRPLGTYTVTYTPTGSYSGYTSTPVSYTVNATTGGQNYSGNNFGIYIQPGTGDVCVDLSAYSTVSPGFPAIYKLNVVNYGTTVMNGTLHLYYDPSLTYSSSTVTPTTVSPSTYSIDWHMNVAIGQTIQVRAYFNCPTTATVGAPVFNSIFFEPDLGFTDINMACNEDSLHQSVQASWDPNGKSVSPEGFGVAHNIDNNQLLNYTIMFHNTGTSPAVNVILVDSVQPELNINSFEMKDASHDYHVQVEGNVITWIFSNIMLPDSATSPDSSYGFVSFKMKPTAALAEGTHVLNRADIYFDYNDAVLTRRAYNTITYKLGINNVATDNVIINLQPNPFTDYTVIRIDGNITSAYELRVIDVLGKVVLSETSTDNSITINRNNLPAGVYMYELRQKGALLGSGKMIAQ